jgi:hypothetical protein
VLVESCNEAIRKENDHLKREVKKLDLQVNKLKKQAKVQPPQYNRSNMVNKLEKGRTAPMIISQQHIVDGKIEYARSAYLNARRAHIKNVIGYKTGDKHNSRVNSNGKEFIKFIIGNSHQEKKKSLNNTNHVFYTSNANASYVSHMSYHEFDTSYVLMRNKFGRIVALYVGPHHKRSKTCVWVFKYLVTNLK